jgi:uncharacterized membrane protein (TIGR02234 family)
MARALAGRRGLVTSVLALVVGGTVALVVAQATWVTVTAAPLGPVGGVGGGPEGVRLAVKGTDAAAAVVPLALLALAGAVGLLATRGWFRRVVGALVAAAGAGLVVDAGRVVLDPGSAVAGPLARQSLASGTGTTYALTLLWPALAVAAGLLVVTAGVVAVGWSSGWPAMGARYESPAGVIRPDRPVDAWTALDRGEDPTVPSTAPTAPTAPASPAPDPEVPE